MTDITTSRAELDRLDDRIAALLCERMTVVRQIGAYKKEHGIPVSDPERQEAILARICEGRAEEDRRLLQAVYAAVFAQSVQCQENS